MRILLDTNIIIAGLLSRAGPPGQLVQKWLDTAFELVTSQAQLDELQRALGYEQLRDRIDPAQTRDFLTNVAVAALMVAPVQPVTVSPDPDDNLILATAIAGQANLIVSGDKPGMLRLGNVEGIPIVTPREALGRLEAAN